MASGSSTDFGFFSIIFESTIDEQMLELPKKFLKRHGETLSSLVFLRPPCGPKWEIGLKRRDKKVWLQQGWAEFVKHYSIGFGYLLYLRYKGKSEFQFKICDLSCCEIRYPSIPPRVAEPDVSGPRKREIKGDDDSGQVLDSSSPREEYISTSSPPHKRVRTSARVQCRKTAGQDKSITQRGTKAKVLTRTQSQTPTEELKTLGSKGRCISQNPYFVIIMERSIVVDRYNLYLPSEFWQKHLNSQYGDAILHVSGGGTWPVKICVRKFGIQRTCLDKDGWKKFALDNNLEVGDRCIFELIYGNRISFKVSISRVADELYNQMPQGRKEGTGHICEPKTECTSDDDFCIHPLREAEGAKSQHRHEKGDAKKGKSKKFESGNHTAVGQRVRWPFRDSKAFEEASKFVSRKPSVILVVTNNYNTRLPVDFVRKHMEQQGQGTLKVGSRSWLIQFSNYKSGSFLTGPGYSRFLKENSLRRGDVCVCELNERKYQKGVVLNVTIFRQNML